jgi:hypothetical protein
MNAAIVPEFAKNFQLGKEWSLASKAFTMMTIPVVSMIRSRPPPQAGCPLGDPGPLAVLTRPGERKTKVINEPYREN